jgi:hypothetical protein
VIENPQTTSLVVPADHIEQLREWAAEEDRSVSSILRRIIQRALEERQERKEAKGE